MSNLAKRVDIIFSQAAEREARLAEQLRETFIRVQDDVRVREERAIATIESALKLPNEQQARSMAGDASYTHSLVSGLKESIERVA